MCYYDEDISLPLVQNKEIAFSESVLSSRHSKSEKSAPDDR
jgi:hypothetical protein